MRSMIAGLVALSTLAACMEGLPGLDPAQPREASPKTCGADQVQDRVGKVAALQDFSALPDVRMLKPDSVMTMDYRAERMNVTTDSAGMITRIWCG